MNNLKWENIKGKNYTIHVLTPEDVKACDKITGQSHEYLYHNFIYREGNQAICLDSSSHSDADYLSSSKNGYTMINL